MKPVRVSVLTLALPPGETPTHVEITGRANALWRELGRPPDQDDRIWFIAERELLAQRRRRALRTRALRKSRTIGQLLSERFPPRPPDRSETSL